MRVLDSFLPTVVDVLTFRSAEYLMLRQFYGGKTAERSGVPLINHIREGVHLMGYIGADLGSRLGYVLHPMLQAYDDLQRNYLRVASEPSVSVSAVVFAMEYRRAANAYLCKPSTDFWTVGDIVTATETLLPQVRDMLIADKVQNFKDFTLHHYGTHPRSEQLNRYFNMWFRRLDVVDYVPQLLALIGMADAPTNLYTTGQPDEMELLK